MAGHSPVEAALREREERYRLVARATRDAVWDWNLKTQAVEWNEAVGELFGYTPEEVGETAAWWYEHIHPEDRERVVRGIHEVIEGGGASWQEEYRYRCRDGGYKTVLDRGHVARDSGGEAVRMIGAMLDLTERRRLEDELRAERARLEAVLEQMPVAVWIAEAPSGRLVAGNRHIEAVIGHPFRPSDTVSEYSEDYEGHHEDGRPYEPHEWPLARALEKGEVVVGEEIEMRWPDGTSRWVRYSAGPIRDAAGRVAGGVVAGQDVSERRRVEAELERANDALERRVEERTRELTVARARAEALAGLSDALQGARTVEEVAQTALEKLGPALNLDYMFLARLRGERVATETSWGAVPPDVLAYMERPDLTLAGTPRIRRVAEGGRAVYVDAYGNEGDAVPFHTPPGAVGYEPVRGPGGVAGVLVACRGLPGPWPPEERDLLARAAATIGLALERTEASERLAGQKAELEERNAEAETFVYTVSHDLRAPLLSIRGMGELLAEAVERGDTDEARFLLGRVNTNAEKMNALLGDLLALSRIGRAGAELETFDLGPVAAAVLAELALRLQARRVEVETPAEWPAVRYPPLEAYQLLANLVGNAAKFAGREGEGPRVRLGWALGDGFVTLRVSDNGPGVAPGLRAKVWGLFQKLDPSAEGTGVGLAIVKRIAERHGGAAWIEDSAGPPEGLGGAVFAVRLPAG